MECLHKNGGYEFSRSVDGKEVILICFDCDAEIRAKRNDTLPSLIKQTKSAYLPIPNKPIKTPKWKFPVVHKTDSKEVIFLEITADPRIKGIIVLYV